MAKLLRLSTIRDHCPFVINPEYVVAVWPRPYLEENDEWTEGTTLTTIAGKEFTVAESCEVVMKQWQGVLGLAGKDIEQERPDSSEFIGELSYRAPSDEHYDWVITYESSANSIACKTEREAEVVMALLKRRPQCGVISMTHDFDEDKWIVKQWVQMAAMQDCQSHDKGLGHGKLP